MSEDLLNTSHEASATPRHRIAVKIFLFTLTALALCSAAAVGAAATYTKMYAGTVYPGVYIGNYPIGGLVADEVKGVVEAVNNRYAKEGVSFVFTDMEGREQRVVVYSVVRGESGGVLLSVNSDEVVAQALAMGRGGNTAERLWQPLSIRFFKPARLLAPVTVDEYNLRDEMAEALRPFEDAPHNATFSDVDAAGKTYTVIAEKSGKAFDHAEILEMMKNSAAALSFAPIQITLKSFEPSVTAQDVEVAAKNLPTVLVYGDISLNYVNPTTQARRDWKIAPKDFVSWLEVKKDTSGMPMVAISERALNDYIEKSISPLVHTSPIEAKFVMEDGKVREFQGSKNGVSVDVAKTISDVVTAFNERNYAPADPIRTVSVSVQIVEPDVKTADVNNLGITDIVGVGVSTFKDSHTNRIKNIANAVKRLNGTLIKPDEEFSANRAAGPYTLENGFLPEMVIKGKQIKPEVGGGMCQIGTTLFRMAMNSGLDITQRQNHSLVVSYYADPVNGNPGTDATLYEPSLDLKFKNDTGNYMLLQTEIDYKKQELTFTLWGKPDGRSGSYTHPLVSKWISPGDAGAEPEIIPVDDGSIPVGVKRCQAAFRGAVASFTYTRFTTSGEKIDRVFDSYYRPLPRICLLGAVKGSCKQEGGCITSTSTASTVTATASTTLDAAN